MMGGGIVSQSKLNFIMTVDENTAKKSESKSTRSKGNNKKKAAKTRQD